MNLTLALLLTQNLGPVLEEDWTVDVITMISGLYFNRRGNLFAFTCYPEEPEDFVADKTMNYIHRRNDFLSLSMGVIETEDPPDFVSPGAIILFIEFTKDSFQRCATDFIMKILKSMHLNLRLIVVLQYHKYVKDKVITFLLERFWGINLRNVIIINSVINNFSPSSVRIFYWRKGFEFRKDSSIKAENVKRITLTKDESPGSLENSLRIGEMLSLVDVSDIGGHFLNVSVAVTPPYVWWKDSHRGIGTEKRHETLKTNKLDGLEVAIIKEFREKYNLSGYFIIHPSEVIAISGLEEEEEANGVLYETAVGLSDIAIGGNLAVPDLYLFFGPSHPYFQDDMVWYVPGPKAIPLWMNNFLIFDIGLWECTGLAFLLVAVMIFFWFRCGLQRDVTVDISQSMLLAWATVVSQSVKPSLPDRIKIFFLSAIIYGMHISLFYTSGLITSIHEVYYETPITTIREAKDENMSVCLSGLSLEFYKSQNISFQMGGNITSTFNVDFNDCLDEVVERRDTIALLPEKTTEYTIPLRYLDEYHMDKIRKLPERLISYPVSMYLTKASPFKPGLNFVIYGLLEGGFLNKWWIDIRFSYRHRLKASRKVLTESGYNSISLRNVIAVFYLYAVLALGSVALFVTEIIWFKLTNGESKPPERLKPGRY